MMRQPPTLQGVRVRTVRDAMLIFNAVAKGVLQKVTRRLDENERSLIQSGNVYVWEERGAQIDSTGLSMERWTDGLHWGPSRAREFLYYQQATEDGAGPTSKRRRTTRATPLTTNPAGASTSRAAAPMLTRQTFSANVTLPEEQQGEPLVRKWHMTAYFAGEHADKLQAIERLPNIGDVPLPEGVFASARSSTRSIPASRRNLVQSQPSLAPAPGPPAGDNTSASSEEALIAGPSQSSHELSAIPATPISASISRPEHDTTTRRLLPPGPQPMVHLGPIPPLPSGAPAARHSPTDPSWDPFAPVVSACHARTSIDLGTPLPPRRSSMHDYPPPPILTASICQPPRLPEPRSTTKDKGKGVMPPPSFMPPSALSPLAHAAEDVDRILAEAKNRPTALAIASLTNGKQDAGFPEGPPHPEDRPELRLAPLRYLEDLCNGRDRVPREEEDEKVVRSFTQRRSSSNQWMRSGS